jgi:hypothetical protein
MYSFSQYMSNKTAQNSSLLLSTSLQLKSCFAIITLIVVLLFQIFVHPVYAIGQSATFTPTADTYVLESNPDINYGTQTQVRVDSSPITRSYLKFEIQGLSGTVTRATLTLYANSSQSVGFDVHSVSDTSWGESTLIYSYQPSYNTSSVGFSGPVSANQKYSIDVTSLVTGNGTISFMLDTPHTTALSLGSRESANPPTLLVETNSGDPIPTLTPTPTPAPTNTPQPTPTPTSVPTSTPAPTPTPDPSTKTTVISRIGDSYYAQPVWGGPQYVSTRLKTVVESAINDLDAIGGGKIAFEYGTFDLKTDYLDIRQKSNIVFEGKGIDQTILQNNTSIGDDTEPFSFTYSQRMTIRGFTISAKGSVRLTSDAIDFDDGSDNLVENVKIITARGRGIVFDGKDAGGSSERNIARNNIVIGIPGDGIELLASRYGRVEGNTIINVGGHGIQLTKSSPQASQPNKQPHDDIVIGNTVDNAGLDGININSGHSNTISGNMITNSSDDTTNRDGIRINSSNNISCNNNIVTMNIATDNQSVKTQTYGLNISNSLCSATIVQGNDFAGNLKGTIHDSGTGTIYQ